jgi:hypothetical protein
MPVTLDLGNPVRVVDGWKFDGESDVKQTRAALGCPSPAANIAPRLTWFSALGYLNRRLSLPWMNIRLSEMLEGFFA